MCSELHLSSDTNTTSLTSQGLKSNMCLAYDRYSMNTEQGPLHPLSMDEGPGPCIPEMAQPSTGRDSLPLHFQRLLLPPACSCPSTTQNQDLVGSAEGVCWGGGAGGTERGKAGCGEELQWVTGARLCCWGQRLPIVTFPSKDNKGTAFSLLLAG